MGRIIGKALIYRMIVIILCAPSRVYITYFLLGIYNRLFGTFESVFFCYAGSRAYVQTYIPELLVRSFRWFPLPIAILHQSGKRGLVVASPLSESEFLDPVNVTQFVRLQKRIRFIAWLLRVDQINLAGILPGVIDRHEVLVPRDTREITARAVWGAVKRLIYQQLEGCMVPVVLIGGAGFIGGPIVELLRAKGLTVYVVDPRRGTSEFPAAVVGERCLVVDVSRKGVISNYINEMWPGMLLLNEVFPRPSRKVVQAIEAKGVEYWHLSGLVGSIAPPLPHGYENAVPCCAAHAAGADPDVVLIRLTRDVRASDQIAEHQVA